jgi:hypothetical protein
MSFKKESKSFVSKQNDKEYFPCFIFNGKDYPKFLGLSILVVILKTCICTG